MSIRLYVYRYMFVCTVYLVPEECQRRVSDPTVLRLVESSSWVLNLGPLKEQYVLLTTEPSSGPLKTFRSYFKLHVSLRRCVHGTTGAL